MVNEQALNRVHNSPPVGWPDEPVCGGKLQTLYATRKGSWFRVGRLCMRCMTFWPDVREFPGAEELMMTERIGGVVGND